MKLRAFTITSGLLFASVALATSAPTEDDASKDPQKADSAQQLASLLISQARFDATLDSFLTAIEKKWFIPDQTSPSDVGEIVKKFRAESEGLVGEIPWKRVIESVAADYAARFTPAEIDQLLAFYRDGVGKKLLLAQPEMTANLIDQIAVAVYGAKLDQTADKNLAVFLGQVGEKERAAIMKTMSADPFPEKLLLGSWFGKDTSDPELHSWWSYTKHPDGSQTETGVDIDITNKTYDRYTMSKRWKLAGRLLIETDLAEPDFSNYFIVENLTADEFTYRIADEELPLGEWATQVDSRKKAAFPEKPEGYDKVENE